jgi:hypothetical protein
MPRVAIVVHLQAGATMGQKLSLTKLIYWAGLENWVMTYNHEVTLKVRRPLRQLRSRWRKWIGGARGAGLRSEKVSDLGSTRSKI